MHHLVTKSSDVPLSSSLRNNFQRDQNALESARKVSDAVNTSMSDVPENQRQAVGSDMGNILATQERNGLFAPMKEVGERERPADLASPEAQAAKLKGQLPAQTAEPVIKAAVEAANAIAFAKPEDMNKAFNAGMDSLRAAGVEPSAVSGVLSQALNNVSKDLRVSTDQGNVDQSFLHDARLGHPRKPSTETIGVADRMTAPGDAAENRALFSRASEVASAIRSANTDALGRNPTKTAVSEHVDRTFQMLRYYK